MSDYSIYPKAIDGYAQIPLVVDKRSPINAESVKRLRSGIINIETAIGVAPEFSDKFGAFPDLSGRVDHLEGFALTLEEETLALKEEMDGHRDVMEGHASALKEEMLQEVNNLFGGIDIDAFFENPTLTDLYDLSLIHI